MADQFSEEDLRIAKEVIDVRLNDGDGSERVSGPHFLNVKALKREVAEEFSRIRSEARAGMREACAKLCDRRKSEWNRGGHNDRADEAKGCAIGIRSLPDIVADEAIERIKREAEKKWRFLANELHWLAKWQHEGRDPGHCNPNTEDCPHHACKRATAAIAALSGKET